MTFSTVTKILYIFIYYQAWKLYNIHIFFMELILHLLTAMFVSQMNNICGSFIIVENFFDCISFEKDNNNTKI